MTGKSCTFFKLSIVFVNIIETIILFLLKKEILIPVFLFYSLLQMFFFPNSRKYTLNIIYIFFLAFLFLSLLYMVDIRNFSFYKNHIFIVIRYLAFFSLVFLMFFYFFHFKKEEFVYLVSKSFPKQFSYMIIVSFFFLEIAYKNLQQTLRLQSIKLGKINGFLNRIKLLPMLIQNTVVNLLSESKYFAISFYNKKIGLNCKGKKLEVLLEENKCHKKSILTLLINAVLLSIINIYFIR